MLLVLSSAILATCTHVTASRGLAVQAPDQLSADEDELVFETQHQSMIDWYIACLLSTMQGRHGVLTKSCSQFANEDSGHGNSAHTSACLTTSTYDA